MNNRFKILLDQINPKVDKKILIFISGFMWCCVGILLMFYAETWLSHYSGRGKSVFYLAGFLIAIPVHKFGFLKLARKNINRLIPVTGKRCVFSFITWKSYMILIVMISMGIFLRHSTIPKNDLSILYNGIGFALFLSGVVYISTSIRLMVTGRKKEA